MLENITVEIPLPIVAFVRPAVEMTLNVESPRLYSKDESHKIWFEVVMNVAMFTDENGGLNENLIAHHCRVSPAI